MKKLLNKRVGYAVLSIAVVASLVAGSFLFKFDSNKALANKQTTAMERLIAERNNNMSSVSMDEDGDENEVVRAVVSLKKDSVMETVDDSTTEYSKKLKKQENKILDSQENIIKKAEKITGNKVVTQTAYLMNSFSIDATRKELRELAKLSGVEKVYESSKHEIQMENAVQTTSVTQEWEAEDCGYTGEGTVVAVIDTGVNYEHQDMVLDKGVKTKYTKEEWEEKIKLLGYGEYKTEKVPFAFKYETLENDCLVKNKKTASECHGYHVAGIVGANGKIKGVAKNAQIVGLQLEGTNYDVCYTDILIRAIEDAVKLGADVINTSLGVDYVSINDMEYIQSAVNKATEAGVVYCNSGGNFGTSSGKEYESNELDRKDSATLKTPSTSKLTLSVAAANTAPVLNKVSAKVKIGNNNMTIEYLDVYSNGFDVKNAKLINIGNGLNEDGELSVEAKKLKNKVAVVSSSEQEISKIMSNLLDKNNKIKAVIYLYDDEEKIRTYTEKKSDTLPVIAIKKSDSENIIKAANISSKITVLSSTKLDVIKRDISMAYFSSWGPATDLTMKPEIAAPGCNIVSTLDGKDNYYSMDGTSMASPFAAGCSAVLISAINDRNLGLEGKELNLYIKNCLMNTADPIMEKAYNVPYSVRKQGSGMIDIYGAVKNNVIATVDGNAKVELREMSSKEKTFTITLKNYGETEASYVLKPAQVYSDKTMNNNTVKYYGITPVQGSTITFNVDKVTVPAKGSVNVTAKVQLSNNYKNNQYVESFISFEGQGVENIGLPVLGFYGNWSEETIIDKSIYDEGTSILEKYLGKSFKSLTGLKANSVTKKYYGTELVKEQYIIPKKTEIEETKEDETDEEDTNVSESLELSQKEKIEQVKSNLGKETYEALIKSGLTEKVLYGDEKEMDKFVSKAEKKPFGLFSIIKINSTKAIKNVTNGFGIGLISVDKNKTFNLNIRTENMLEYNLIDIKKLIDILSYGYENETLFKELNREYVNEHNSKYMLLILRNKDNTTKGDIIADVSLTESEGSNCYVNNRVYNGEKVAFSPNNDGINDIVVPTTTNLRSTKYNNIYVLDSNKNKIRTLASNITSSKVILNEGLNSRSELSKIFKYDLFNMIMSKGYVHWDGKVYDAKEGKYIDAKEGQYYIQIESRVFENSLPQIITMPVKIDTTKPKVEKYEIRQENNDTIVTFKASDDIGLSPYYYIDTEYNAKNVTRTATYTNTFVDTQVNEAGEYELNLGNISDSKVTLMFEDQAGNIVVVSKEVEDTNSDTNTVDENNTNEDSTAPVIKVINNKQFKKTVINENQVNILLKHKFINNNKFKLQVKVEDENLDENSFIVSLNNGSIENVTVKNEGKGLYTISFAKIDLITYFNILVQDKNGNTSLMNVNVYKNIMKYPYNFFYSEKYMEIYDDELIASKDKINSDGTYTIRGKVSDKVESIKIDNQVVKVDSTTREFSVNRVIKKGFNLYKFVLIVDEDEVEYDKVLYYDKINVLIDTKNINLGKNSVITTTEDTVTLKGEISSYVTLNTINVNNKNIYSCLFGRTSTDGKELKVPFETTVKLQKGMNKVLIEARNMAGQTEQFTIMVNYK